MDQKFQNKLLVDVISQHFNEADDLMLYVQNRTGTQQSYTACKRTNVLNNLQTAVVGAD